MVHEAVFHAWGHSELVRQRVLCLSHIQLFLERGVPFVYVLYVGVESLERGKTGYRNTHWMSKCVHVCVCVRVCGV